MSMCCIESYLFNYVNGDMLSHIGVMIVKSDKLCKYDMLCDVL